MSPRKQHIMFSTKDPPSIQRIPWPIIEDEENEDYDDEELKKSMLGHDTWILNDIEMPWLVNPNGTIRFFDCDSNTDYFGPPVTVTRMSYSRAAKVETWITSDGRAYFVQLAEFLADLASNSSSSSMDEDLQRCVGASFGQ